MSASLACLLMLLMAVPGLKEWADGPAGIVLSSVEKKTWSRLQTDQERQTFINQFWRGRDRGEFEKRVSEADRLFGGETAYDGWQTERGRTYVLLGAPASRAQFKGHGRIRPAELWFYSGKTQYSQLPSFFYLLFYQRDEIGDYRRYSPFVDQPRSLVKSARDNQDAYRILSSTNTELAHASMTLIPNEPIDSSEFAPSMLSDVILAQINQIPKWEFERIGQLGKLRDAVAVTLEYGGTLPMKVYPFAIDAESYVVDFVVDRPATIQLDNARTTTVVWRENNEVGRNTITFPKESPLTGRLILKVGSYVVETTVADPEGKQSFVAREAFELAPPQTPLAMSEVVFFRNATESKAHDLKVPFQHFGYDFVANTKRRYRPADQLQVLFQVRRGEDSGEKGTRNSDFGFRNSELVRHPNSEIRIPNSLSPTAPSLAIEYTIANINTPTPRWSFRDQVAMNRFDANGLLLNSKTFSLRELQPGRYFLVIVATDPRGRRASQTVSFEVLGLEESSTPF